MADSKKTEAVGKYGGWRVYPDGEIRHVDRKLRIYPDRLREPDWWVKLFFGLDWMATEWNDFMPAWAMACEIAGIKEINIKTQL